MLDIPESWSFPLLLGLIFLAVLLLVEGLFLFWSSSRGSAARKKRLARISLETIRNDSPLRRNSTLSELPTMERLLLAAPRLHRAQSWLRQAGLNWNLSTLVLMCIVAALCALSLVMLWNPAMQLFWALAGLSAGALPLLLVLWRRARRLRRIEQQLPDALDLIARAMRAGHAFSSSLQMMSEEMPQPLGSEFATVHDEVNFGVSLQRALLNLAERVPLTDMRYFVVAVLIQRESGGNLTELLTQLGTLIRERLKFRGRVRVLTAEGRMSATILALMPFGMGALLSLLNPSFMTPLWTDPMGLAMIQVLLMLMAVGVLLLIRIIRIRI